MNPDDADTPPVEDLEQFPGGLAIPVRVVEQVRVDELPTILVDPVTHLIPFAPTEKDFIKKILREDPRRARVTIIVGNNDVMVSGRPGNLRLFAGGWMPAGVPIPLHHNIRSELYVRGVLMNTAGTDIQWANATDVAVVTVFEERWAN